MAVLNLVMRAVKERKLARWQGGWTHVHMLELGGTAKTPQRRCDTTIGIESRRALGRLAVQKTWWYEGKRRLHGWSFWTYSRFKTFKSPPEIGKFGRCDEDRGKLLHNDTSEVKVLTILRKIRPVLRNHIPYLFLFEDFSKCLVNALRAEVEAQLPNNETSTCLE
jgi:hypothetical protein